MAVYTPNLQLVRYTGETPRKLWEIKARNIPTLNKGDLVLLDATTAVLMVKKYGFEMCDNSKLTFGTEGEDKILGAMTSDTSAPKNESLTTTVIDMVKNAFGSGDDKKQDAYKLPLASEIMTLSADEVIQACKYVGVSTSNKRLDNLKSLLLPYLPQA